ncbi:GNAT family N-acetyltransferase [Acetivibrio straminisolvens]|uniref:GNAT family N-acetyltransferase n=1 Tax=Acetivibrio straminisolvens TaxID=253314 RepID=UPI00223F7B30|nr:GNAT family N-acetyltransferase [Acetivibrio straminisolvens]
MEFTEIKIYDIKQVAHLHNELDYYIQRETKDEYWDFGELTIDNAGKYLEEFIDSEERKVIVAEDIGRIIGFIAGEIVKCHLPISSIRKVGYISGAYVLPEYRQKGVVKKLESEIVKFFKAKGLKYAELNFLSQNNIARKSWEALGYKVFREQARKQI